MSNGSGDTVNVFISHKHEDAKAAKAFKEKLSLFSGGRAKFFISEEIPPGTDWFRWIKEHLSKSNMLILLFMDPTASWDWCLYEAGLFTQLDGDDDRRVICLHSPSTAPPPQLKHLQPLRAEPDAMRDFLRLFFGSSELTGIEPPLSKDFAQNDHELASVANDICSMIGSRIAERHYYNNYLLLRVEDPHLIDQNKIPDDGVLESDQSSLAMFGLREKPTGRDNWTWGELKASLERPEDRAWLEELGRAIEAASEGLVVEPTGATFQALNTGKHYRAVLQRLDLEPDGSMAFYVVLVEQPAQPGD